MISTAKLSRLSGWDYAPTDVLDVQARPLFCSPASPAKNSPVVVPQSPKAMPTFNSNHGYTTDACGSAIEPTYVTSPFGGARVEPDVYCAVETYKGVALRYTEDPKRPGAVRVYVESPIDWKGRSSSPHPTHLWEAGHDGTSHPPYVCIKAECAPKTYEEAKKGAEAWVRGTQHYIATGQTISERIARGETI